MSTMMGCELVSYDKLEFSGYQKLIKKLGLKVLKVPVRMRGLTSSGKGGKCYYNTDNLVEALGGNTVVGWAVKLRTDVHGSGKNLTRAISIKLHGHAVWLNEEGNLSDPTARSWGSYTEYENTKYNIWGPIQENGKVYRQYVPLKIGTPIDCYGCETIFLECLTNGKGEIIRDWKMHFYSELNSQFYQLNWKELNQAFIDSKVIYNERWQPNFDSWESFCQYRRKEGSFTEVSIATGKTLEEIRIDRLLRKAA